MSKIKTEIKFDFEKLRNEKIIQFSERVEKRQLSVGLSNAREAYKDLFFNTQQPRKIQELEAAIEAGATDDFKTLLKRYRIEYPQASLEGFLNKACAETRNAIIAFLAIECDCWSYQQLAQRRGLDVNEIKLMSDYLNNLLAQITLVHPSIAVIIGKFYQKLDYELRYSLYWPSESFVKMRQYFTVQTELFEKLSSLFHDDDKKDTGEKFSLSAEKYPHKKAVLLEALKVIAEIEGYNSNTLSITVDLCHRYNETRLPGTDIHEQLVNEVYKLKGLPTVQKEVKMHI
jgi:hypothetical protein